MLGAEWLHHRATFLGEASAASGRFRNQEIAGMRRSNMQQGRAILVAEAWTEPKGAPAQTPPSELGELGELGDEA